MCQKILTIELNLPKMYVSSIMLLHDIMSCPPCPGAQHSPGQRERERDQFSRPARASVITQLTADPGVPGQFLTRIGHYKPRALRSSLLSPLFIMWSAMLRGYLGPGINCRVRNNEKMHSGPGGRRLELKSILYIVLLRIGGGRGSGECNPR